MRDKDLKMTFLVFIITFSSTILAADNTEPPEFVGAVAQAADLVIFGGKLSFRAIEYGLFALLLVADVIWSPVLFMRQEAPAQEDELDADAYEMDQGLAELPVH